MKADTELSGRSKHMLNRPRRDRKADGNTSNEHFAEDVRSGHVRVLAQLVAGGAGSTQLGRKVAARVEPWLAFTRESIDRVLPASPIGTVMPSEDLAFALTSLYLGMELMLNLDRDITRAERLFDDAAR